MPTVFRWNIARREQLGRLIDGEPAPSEHQVEPEPAYDAILREVRGCTARVLAGAGDSRLVFIGRSPESLYDYLTGALSGTSWAPRATLLNLSLRGGEGWGQLDAESRAALCEQFRSMQLDPASIARSARPIALIDLICEGVTFEALFELLFAWTDDEGIDARLVRRRLRVVGITSSYDSKMTPVRWRRLGWATEFRPSALAGVSVPWWFWSYLGDSQKKVSRSNPLRRWADPEMARPPREPEHVNALRLAVALHDAGRTRAERDALAAELAEQPAMRHAWCRVLAAEIRAAGRPKRIERSFGSTQRVRSWNRGARPR